MTACDSSFWNHRSTRLKFSIEVEFFVQDPFSPVPFRAPRWPKKDQYFEDFESILFNKALSWDYELRLEVSVFAQQNLVQSIKSKLLSQMQNWHQQPKHSKFWKLVQTSKRSKTSNPHQDCRPHAESKKIIVFQRILRFSSAKKSWPKLICVITLPKDSEKRCVCKVVELMAKLTTTEELL